MVVRATERHCSWSGTAQGDTCREAIWWGVSEHGPCRHPLATLLTSRMSLADVVEIECSSGCGHRLYSDRGPIPCPCHWSAATAAQVAAALRLQPTAVHAYQGDSSTYADVRMERWTLASLSCNRSRCGRRSASTPSRESSVMVTGALAAVKFRSFARAFINVSLEASSRPCSQDHVQIGVTAKLYNGSQNLAKAERLEWECRGIATYASEVIEQKRGEYFQDAGGYSRTESENSEFPWNLQQRIIKKGLDIAIEPNETSHDSVDVHRASILHGGADTVVHPNQAQERHGMDRRHLPRQRNRRYRRSNGKPIPESGSTRGTFDKANVAGVSGDSDADPMIGNRDLPGETRDLPVNRPVAPPSAETPMEPPPHRRRLPTGHQQRISYQERVDSGRGRIARQGERRRLSVR